MSLLYNIASPSKRLFLGSGFNRKESNKMRHRQSLLRDWLGHLPQNSFLKEKILALGQPWDAFDFYGGVLQIARELRIQGETLVAQTLYQNLIEELHKQPEFQDLLLQAERGLSLTQGGINFKDKAQLFFEGVPREMKNVGMIAGMMAGSTALNLGRYGVGKILGTSLTQTTRVALGNTVGFLFEGMAFESILRGVHILQGKPHANFAEGLKSAYWMMGCLRLTGLSSRALVTNSRVQSLLQRDSRTLSTTLQNATPWLGEYAGLYLSHTQAWRFNIGSQAGPMAGLDALFTLGQFRVASGILHMAPHYSQLQKKMQRGALQVLHQSGKEFYGMMNRWMKPSINFSPSKNLALASIVKSQQDLSGLNSPTRAVETSLQSFSRDHAKEAPKKSRNPPFGGLALPGSLPHTVSPATKDRRKAHDACERAREQKQRANRAEKDALAKALANFNREHPIPETLATGDQISLQKARRIHLSTYGGQLTYGAKTSGLSAEALEAYLQKGTWPEFSEGEASFLQGLYRFFAGPNNDPIEGQSVLASHGLIYPRPRNLSEFSRVNQEALGFWYSALEKRFHSKSFSGPRFIQFRLNTDSKNSEEIINFRITSRDNKQTGAEWITLRLDRLGKPSEVKATPEATIESRYVLVMSTSHQKVEKQLMQSPMAQQGDLIVYSEAALLELFHHPHIFYKEDLDALFAYFQPQNQRLILRIEKSPGLKGRITLGEKPKTEFRFDQNELIIENEGGKYRLTSALGEEGARHQNDLGHSPAGVEGAIMVGSAKEKLSNPLPTYLIDLQSMEDFFPWYININQGNSLRGTLDVLALRYQLNSGDRFQNPRLASHFDAPLGSEEGQIRFLKLGKRQIGVSSISGAGAQRVLLALSFSPAATKESGVRGVQLVTANEAWVLENSVVRNSDLATWTHFDLESLYLRAYPNQPRRKGCTANRRDVIFYIRFIPHATQTGAYHYQIGRLEDYQEKLGTQTLFIKALKPSQFRLEGAQGAGIEDKIKAAKDSDAYDLFSLDIPDDHLLLSEFDPSKRI